MDNGSDIKYVTPIEAVEAVLEERGFDVDECGDSYVITFGIPNQHGGSTTAEAEFFPETNQLEISAVFTYGKVPKLLIPGLLTMFNSFHNLMPGVRFVLEEGKHDEVDDEIRVSVMTFVVTDTEAIEMQTRLGIEYIEGVVQTVIPAIMSYVSQRIKVRVGEDGLQRVTEFSAPLSSCLAMAEIGTFGRA